MLIGMGLSVLFYFALAAMTGQLWLYYVLYVFANVVGLTASGLTCSRAVSEVFVKSRGLSLAVTRSGLAITAAFLPSILFALISAYGWRGGYAMLGALVACFSLPAVYAWIDPRGRACRAGAEWPATPHLPSWPDLIGNRRILLLCLGAGLDMHRPMP